MPYLFIIINPCQAHISQIPFSMNDRDALKFKADKCLKTIGFMLQSKIPRIHHASELFCTNVGCLKCTRWEKGSNVLFIHFVIFTGHYFMAGVDVIVAEPGNERAAVALAAFVEICLMQQKVILVRFVKRNNTAPKVGILIPCMN